jgi:hypothetical protein
MSAFALLIPPANLPVDLRRLTERSSTMRASLNLLHYLPTTQRSGALCSRLKRLQLEQVSLSEARIRSFGVWF